MADQHRNALSTEVTRERCNALGQPGPFVCVRRRLDNGEIIQDWYTVNDALRFADELRRAAVA